MASNSTTCVDDANVLKELLCWPNVRRMLRTVCDLHDAFPGDHHGLGTGPANSAFLDGSSPEAKEVLRYLGRCVGLPQQQRASAFQTWMQKNQDWVRGRRFLGIPDVCLPQPMPPYIDYNQELAAASPALYDMYCGDLLRLLSYGSPVTTDPEPYLELYRWTDPASATAWYPAKQGGGQGAEGHQQPGGIEGATTSAMATEPADGSVFDASDWESATGEQQGGVEWHGRDPSSSAALSHRRFNRPRPIRVGGRLLGSRHIGPSARSFVALKEALMAPAPAGLQGRPAVTAAAGSAANVAGEQSGSRPVGQQAGTNSGATHPSLAPAPASSSLTPSPSGACPAGTGEGGEGWSRPPPAAAATSGEISDADTTRATAATPPPIPAPPPPAAPPFGSAGADVATRLCRDISGFGLIPEGLFLQPPSGSGRRRPLPHSGGPIDWCARLPEVLQRAHSSLPWFHPARGSGLVLAGGAALAMAIPGVPASDLDLFLVVPSLDPDSRTRRTADELRAAALQLVQETLEALRRQVAVYDRNLRVYALAGSKLHTLDVLVLDEALWDEDGIGPVAGRNVVAQLQLVLRLYESPAQVVHGFDVDVCAVLYDGADVWAAGRALRALHCGFMLMEPVRQSPSYEMRLHKYSRRLGLDVLIPGLDPLLLEPAFKELEAMQSELDSQQAEFLSRPWYRNDIERSTRVFHGRTRVPSVRRFAAKQTGLARLLLVQHLERLGVRAHEVRLMVNNYQAHSGSSADAAVNRAIAYKDCKDFRGGPPVTIVQLGPTQLGGAEDAAWGPLREFIGFQVDDVHLQTGREALFSGSFTHTPFNDWYRCCMTKLEEWLLHGELDWEARARERIITERDRTLLLPAADLERQLEAKAQLFTGLLAALRAGRTTAPANATGGGGGGGGGGAAGGGGSGQLLLPSLHELEQQLLQLQHQLFGAPGGAGGGGEGGGGGGAAAGAALPAGPLPVGSAAGVDGGGAVPAGPVTAPAPAPGLALMTEMSSLLQATLSEILGPLPLLGPASGGQPTLPLAAMGPPPSQNPAAGPGTTHGPVGPPPRGALALTDPLLPVLPATPPIPGCDAAELLAGNVAAAGGVPGAPGLTYGLPFSAATGDLLYLGRRFRLVEEGTGPDGGKGPVQGPKPSAGPAAEGGTAPAASTGPVPSPVTLSSLAGSMFGSPGFQGTAAAGNMPAPSKKAAPSDPVRPGNHPTVASRRGSASASGPARTAFASTARNRRSCRSRAQHGGSGAGALAAVGPAPASGGRTDDVGPPAASDRACAVQLGAGALTAGARVHADGRQWLAPAAAALVALCAALVREVWSWSRQAVAVPAAAASGPDRWLPVLLALVVGLGVGAGALLAWRLGGLALQVRTVGA